jgi:glucose-6-phosphate 1-epimerase
MDRHNLPDALRFETTEGTLVCGIVSTPLTDAEFYLQGAHVTHWAPKGHAPVLFMSSKSLFAPGKAIRGGIPIVFPWFGPRPGDEPGPSHGFARTSLWTVQGARLTDTGEVEVMLALESGEAANARLRILFGVSLRLELQVRNDSRVPFLYEEAFHSYFAIADIAEVSVTGLEETTYIDKTDGGAHKLQHAEPVRCNKETDRVHLNTGATCVVHDPIANRRIVVEKSGSNSTVVWNPWSEKAAGMPDMGTGEWRRMICVESGNAADNAITLAPGTSHVLTTSIRVD